MSTIKKKNLSLHQVHKPKFDVYHQLVIVQWALPLILVLIVFVYETGEHIISKREIPLSSNFLAETIFFGIMGPTAVWIVLWWIRKQWIAHERDKQVLQHTYEQLARSQAHLNILHTQRGELLNRLMTVQEEERRYLARELHDELGQLLTGLDLNLKLCQNALPEDLHTALQYLTQARQLVQNSIEQSHQLVSQLRPTALDDLGLVSAIQDEIRARLQPGGLKASLHVEGLKERLQPSQEIAVFRIVQEAFTNILRHAHAQHVWINIREDGKQLEVLIEDDGIGIPNTLEGNPQKRTFGLLGMKERAEALNGRVELHRRQPKGTCVKILIPLESSSND
ncbi:MAG: sensor histidine kinase [Chloroflexi bacterium]|nr:MAG: sensor histidine kinase [Chloroflexota bacterium]